MHLDRFAYMSNVQNAGGFRNWRSPFWPPSSEYAVFCLDLVNKVPIIPGEDLLRELSLLNSLVDFNWQASKVGAKDNKFSMVNGGQTAASLYKIATMLPRDEDRRALQIRARAIEAGYDDVGLLELARTNEGITLIAGNIATWYGKQKGGLPTAFGCVRDEKEGSIVGKAFEYLDDCAKYLFSLHKHLRLGNIPAFSPGQIFFMAGEGNRHPKHIAYFMPGDEGVKHSPFKKTYYFVNTHRALIDLISLPLANRYLDIIKPVPSHASELGPIPTLGVLAHEFGHAVHLKGRDFSALNSADRWASVVLQEAAADVFGMLMIAGVLAPAFQLSCQDVIFYHLAECLRYIDRGLGFFPDSDGMYLQLNYLTRFGALRVDPKATILNGDTDVIVAAYRSLARVLADTLLASDVDRSISLYHDFGPGTINHLAPLIARLQEAPPKTLEYIQEFQQSQGKDAVNRSNSGIYAKTPNSKFI